MSKPPQKLISDIGKQLSHQSRLSKDFLVKSLRQAASALLELDQLPSLEPFIRPFSESIVKHGLLHHKDKDVRLLVAVCLCEIIRVLAPKPSFDDTVFKDIFELFISMFMELADTTSPYFSRRVKILETIATLKCCVKLLDLNCADLILKIFNTFFSVVRKEHQQSVISSMLSIMSLLLNELNDEEVPKLLLEVILRNLKNNEEGPDRASYHLAISLIQGCAKILKPAVCGFLRSCISDSESVPSDLKECFHEIIFEIFQCMPHMLLADVPNLALELVSDQVDVRIKSVNLIGKLLALAEDHAIHDHHYLFVELLKRFSDKSAEVRISVIRAVKTCYMANPFTIESQKILSSLEGRLLDLDASVRIEAIAVVCDLAKFSLKKFPEVLISRAIERLRDKMISVRKEALKKLLEVYCEYCTKCHEGQMTLNEVYEQVPCKILMLSYDKNLKEFSFQNLEHLLAVDLFPASLPQYDVMMHWIYLYSLFTPAHVKAFNLILCQKRRFQTEMQNYLSLRLKAKGAEEVNVKIKNAFKRMSAMCPNAVKAEDFFDKLNLLKDDDLLLQLSRLLEEPEISRAKALRENLLKDVGKKHPLFEFFDLLSLKCLNNIFCSEHIKYILDHISGDRFRDDYQEECTFNLLSDIARNFPKLMRGSEQQFKTLLLEQDSPGWGKLLQILAKVGSYMTMELSEIYPLLERLCLEGTRAQSKTAISAIASLLGPAEHFLWVNLCQKLVESLHNGQNLPTVLQSLGCIAQHAVVAYQKHETGIFTYIRERILGKNLYEDAIVVDEKTGSKVSFHCKLKIFGLKTLVKSILSKKVNHEEMQIINLLDILSKLLLIDELADVATTCENDMAHLRLAAANSILWISRRWETCISPHICESVILMAKDSSSFVRNAFLDKTHKLLKQRTASRKFACAFALAASDCVKDLRDKSVKYLIEFIKEDSKAVHTFSASGKEGSMTDSPAYIMVFLLHILSHDAGYPCVNSDNEEQTVQFFRPLLLLVHVLVNSQFVDGDLDLVKRNFLYLRSIFRAIKRAEDAINHENTPKLHILAETGMYVLNALKLDNINLSQAPGLVLLPSSLYKTSETRRSSEDTFSPAEWVVTENLLKKLVQVMKCDFFQFSSSTVKRSRKFLKEDLTTSKQVELQRKVTTDKNIAEKEIASTYILEACPKGREHSEIVHSSEETLHNGSSLIGEIETDNIKDTTSLRVQEHHVDSECATLELFEIESDISTQEMDVSLSVSQQEERKRKNSNEFSDCLDHDVTHIRHGRSSEGSTVSFSQRCGSKKQCSNDFGKGLVTISGQGGVKSRGSQTDKRQVLLDKTNSLSVNGLKKHRQLKKSCLGLEVSLDTSESDVSHENKDAIAFRTRRKKG